jgi:CRISPR type IV-associated protein Csf3
MYETLKVTAYLQTAVIGDHALPFDAILFYLAMHDEYGAEEVTLPMRDIGVRSVELCLDRRGDGEWWYYAASWAQWPQATAKFTDHWHKRLDTSLVHLINWRGKKARIDVQSGSYKAYRMPVFARHALHIDWYVVGDKAEIERLLHFATHIGKKTAQGWGAVLKWNVESISEDYSVSGPNGELMRALPAAQGIQYGIRPSYWAPANKTTCRVPR